jgi:aromatic ring-cleaving dioxygenase
MVEINFHTRDFTEIMTFLMLNHGENPALIHPETKNDLLDHTVHAIWLGKQLTLDVSRF